MNIVAMLQSVDVEDHVVGLHIINLWTIEDILPMMICYKHGFSQEEAWEREAPRALELLKKNTKLHAKVGVTTQSLYNAIIEMKAPLQYIQFTLDEFAKHLMVLSSTHPDIKEISITVNPKDNE